MTDHTLHPGATPTRTNARRAGRRLRVTVARVGIAFGTAAALAVGEVGAQGAPPATPHAARVIVAPTGSARPFDDCAAAAWCPAMVALPAATFVMGSPRNEPGRFDDEDQRQVHVAAFAVGRDPVTRGQWGAFVAATRHPTPTSPCAYALVEHASWQNPGFPQDDQHPVVCVTWNEAQDYARWLTTRTRHHYRLLSDAEWEYAARAGTTSAYPWGAVASHEFGNTGQDKCCGGAVRGRDQWMFTSPVGSFPPNAFGLYDMHGNVTVWVETCADSTEKLPIPRGARGCVRRYARGALYADYPAMGRSAAKNFAPPPDSPLSIATYRSSGFGVRVARDLDKNAKRP